MDAYVAVGGGQLLDVSWAVVGEEGVKSADISVADVDDGGDGVGHCCN